MTRPRRKSQWSLIGFRLRVLGFRIAGDLRAEFLEFAKYAFFDNFLIHHRKGFFKAQ